MVEQGVVPAGRRIEDYGLIGNLHTVALVSRAGSIDWFCPGRFDSPACFARLLGDDRHGYWAIEPIGEAQTERAYLADSLLLKTTVRSKHGVAELLDYMPVQSDCHLVRRIRCLQGRMSLRFICSPKFQYGRDQVEVVQEEGGFIFRADDIWLRLSPNPALKPRGDGSVVGDIALTEGDDFQFVLSHCSPHQSFESLADPAAAQEQCLSWWITWVSQCTYKGPWRDAVVRSLITLKALIYAPTGALIAAATTSLPEVPGGSANWDYRYTWPRDAALVFDVLLRSGYPHEEEEWRDWLVRAVRDSNCELKTLYTADAQLKTDETTLDWLPGYGGAQPVRIGNAAGEQFQLDLRGEVIDMLHLVRKEGQTLKPEMWRLQCHLLGRLHEEWRKPDTGIWESRDSPKHYVHSKVFAWAAFARSLHDVEAYTLEAPVDEWQKACDGIREEILNKGLDPSGRYFVRFYGDDQVDASLLMIPLLGFLPPDDPRIVATVAEIERHFCTAEGFVYRNPLSEYTGREGAFILCTYWLADYYMIAGNEAKAIRLFETLLSIRNDLGLLAEQYDPVNKTFLGNFPQSFSHLSLVKSALLIGAHQKVEFSGDGDA